MKWIAVFMSLFVIPDQLVAQASSENEGSDCEVEDWNVQMRGIIPMIVGATTCPTGKLTYRLYDEGGKFLTSGFHFFDGYAFQAYPTLSEVPAAMTMRYVIDAR